MIFSGSGKTFTMNGSKNDPGVIPQTIKYISGLKDNACGKSYLVTLSMFEIYNNKMFDLINCSKNRASAVDSIDKLEKIRDTCDGNILDKWYENLGNRKTAATVGNASSSRSHAITTLELTSNHLTENSRTVTINLVDLAGNESAKTTENIDETKAINSSLSALTGVILNLKKGNMVIDYGQCMLTKILKPSLSEKSKILLIVNLAPSDESACIKTLSFASSMTN